MNSLLFNPFPKHVLSSAPLGEGPGVRLIYLSLNLFSERGLGGEVGKGGRAVARPYTGRTALR